MRELDLLLTTFLERRYRYLSDTNQQIFEDLLAYPDVTLYDYLMGRQVPTNSTFAYVIQQIQRTFTD